MFRQSYAKIINSNKFKKKAILDKNFKTFLLFKKSISKRFYQSESKHQSIIHNLFFFAH